MEDWGLQAVVKGYCTSTSLEAHTNSLFMESSSFSSPSSSPSSSSCNLLPFCVQEDGVLLHSFSHPFDQTSTALDEHFYKPFCANPALHPLISSPTTVTSSINVPKDVELLEKKPKDIKDSSVKNKKRKNQQKREVKEVKEDGLSSDKWAWRKYGQKPIKGSPYPRSYYRCSSSKGCSARKQVERSSSNPEIFIITYTAEHTHPHPVRRSLLAGSTRNRFPSSSSSRRNNKACLTEDEIVPPVVVTVKKEEEPQNDVVSNEMDMMLSHDVDHGFLDQFFSDGFNFDAWFLDQSTINLGSSPNINSEDSTWGLPALDRFLNEEQEEEEEEE